MTSVVIIFLLSLLLSVLSFQLFRKFWPRKSSKTENDKAKKLLINLGSGGHTSEMLQMIKGSQMSLFKSRIYYISSGDTLSVEKAHTFEEANNIAGMFHTRIVYRARRVKQSWLSTPFTAALSFIDALRYLQVDRPDVIICNGPGTCVVLVLAALMLRTFRIMHCRIIFVESFARVYKLSLSGRILLRLVDRFLVMWPELAEIYARAEYAGKLI